MMAGPALTMEKRLSTLLPGRSLPAGSDPVVHGVTMDSREVRPGYLFLACKGLTVHGLAFAADAIERGAAAILWEPDGGVEVAGLSVPALRVDDLSAQAGEIAARFYDWPSRRLRVIGITGTNGKTSVAHYVAQSLDHPGERAALVGTLGTGLYGEVSPSTHTTPDAVTNQRLLAEFLARGASSVAMEVSSHALDQARVAGIAFDTAVFTNLSHDHLDYHGTLEAYESAKRRLFSWPALEAAVVNVDDVAGQRIFEALPADLRKVAVSMSQGLPGAQHVVASEVQPGWRGMSFELRSSWGRGRVRSHLLGRFNVANLLSTAAVLLLGGMSFERVLARLEQIRPVPGRMEVVSGGSDLPLAVVDFAHTPDALEQALRAVRSHASGRVICVFGCGGDRDRAKRPLMGRIAERLADIVILTNDNPRSEKPERIVAEIRGGLAAPDLVPVMLDRREAIEAALEMAAPGDVVLVAGKGHEDYQIIGRQRFDFSDRAVIEAWMERRT